MKYRLFLLAVTALAFSLHADITDPTQDPSISEKTSRLYVGGYGSYGYIDGMYEKDGQYAQFRFSLGVDAIRLKIFNLGFEAGIQSGNTMRVNMNSALEAAAGGLPPEAVLQPFLDLLLTLRWDLTHNFLFLLKGGAAYRELHFINYTSSKDSLRRVNGELQAGFGYQLTKHARLVALYQGIYSNNSPKLTLSDNSDVYMHHIPTQQAGLLGIEYSF